MDNVGVKRVEIAQLKKEIRKNILAKRDKIPMAEKAKYDLAIKDIITEMEEYRQADVILAYVSFRSEADTLLLIKQALSDGKHVFAPKVASNEMEFWQITAMEDLQEGYRGILEPIQSVSFPDWVKKYYYNHTDIVSGDANKDRITDRTVNACKVMMWMPGAAFDKTRHRIGYGGGFYDRYLNRSSQLSKQTTSAEQSRPHFEPFTLTTVAIAYSCQVLEQIPYEKHDIKPALLVTERGILETL